MKNMTQNNPLFRRPFNDSAPAEAVGNGGDAVAYIVYNRRRSELLTMLQKPKIFWVGNMNERHMTASRVSSTPRR